jgi:hypothetical protein
MVVDVVPPDLLPGKAAVCSPPTSRRRGRMLRANATAMPLPHLDPATATSMPPPIWIPPPQPPCPLPYLEERGGRSTGEGGACSPSPRLRGGDGQGCG